jgi:uncharacterized repeat protein (TIGR01451 family)
MFCFRFGLQSALKFSVLLLAATSCLTSYSAERMTAHPTEEQLSQTMLNAERSALPMVFEENAGQLPEGAAFAGRTQNYTVEVRPSELRFELLGAMKRRTIRLSFSGSQGGRPVGLQDAGFRSNFYFGNDPKNWHPNVRNFDRVALRGLYPGIDATFYVLGGRIEHDFLLAPGADPSRLVMGLDGASKIAIAASGDLILASEEGDLVLHKPSAYQELADGRRQAVDVSFEVAASGEAGKLRFKLGRYDHRRALVIDPVISYATYVTGAAGSTAAAVTTDGVGNVYLTGSTASIESSFGAETSEGAASISGATTFIAKLSAADSGSKITWLTYYGATLGSVTPAAITLPSGSGVVFVGGMTTHATLTMPSTPTFDSTPVGNPGISGFVASFDTGSGAFTSGTYVAGTTIDGGETEVKALASSTLSGKTVITIAGSTSSISFPTTPNAYPVSSALTSMGFVKGFVLALDSTLTTQSYGSYLGGFQHTTVSETSINGLAVDSTGNIYVAGTTTNDFPKAGAYPTSPSTPGSLYGPPITAGDTNGFTAQIIPGTTTSTLGYSFWTGGSGNDAINGLALDSANGLIVFGQTSSPDLLTNAAVTQSPTSTSTGVATVLDLNEPATAPLSGFAFKFDHTGFEVAATYLGAPNATTALSFGTTDAAGNVYLSGETNAIKATFPQQTSLLTTSSIANIPMLASGQDLSPDSTSTIQNERSFLMRMPSILDSVDYVAYFGASAGSSTPGGVAVDGSNPANAYVLLSDFPSATPGSFTTAAAAQQIPQMFGSSTPSAYLAQVAFTAPGSAAAILAGTNSFTPSPVGFLSPTDFSSLTLTWQVTGSGSGAKAVVFNLPYSANLQAYAALPTVTVGGTAVTGTCVLGTSSIANANPGITCVIPTLGVGMVAQFVVTAAVGSGAQTTTPGSFPVPAQAFDGQGDNLDLTQTITTAGVPTLTLTNSVTPGTVNAALSSSDVITPNTQVTYSYVITNTSAVDSPATRLTTSLGSASNAFTVLRTASSTLCDPTTTACDVAAGATLTYTVSGVYLASDFGSTISGPFTATTAAPTVTSTPQTQDSTVTGTTTSVMIKANANLSITVTTSTATFNGGFRLGDSNVQLNVKVTNSGPNQAGSATFTVTLPLGFVAASSAVTSGTGLANCSTAPFTTCTVTNIAGEASAVFTVTGKFSDTGTSSDAVPPPVTVAGVPSTTSYTSTSSASVTAQIPALGLTVSSGTFAPSSSAASVSIPVARVNILSYAIAATAPLANNTANELNTQNLGDSVTYTVTLRNTGVSVARGVLFTIPVPSAATVTLNPTTFSPTYSVTPSTANALVCAPYTAGATSVTCFENDLNVTPTVATTTPAAETYTITYTATFSEATVPATTASGTVSVSQTAGTFFAAAAGFTVGSTGGVSPAALTIQRNTQLVQSVTYSTIGSAPATYENSSLNLAQFGTGTTPGIHDTISLTLQTWNIGPNDAAGVLVQFTLPNYFLMTSAAPSGCLLTGPNPTVGAGGSTLTCTVPPPAANPQAELISCLSAGCTANIAPTALVPPVGGAVYLYAITGVEGKFVDNGTSADAVAQTLKSSTVATGMALAMGNDVDPHTTNSGTNTITIQRAAHIKLATPVVVSYTDNTATTVAGQQTPLVSGGTVYNCIRYSFSVTNTGVNIANQPTLTYGSDFSPPAGFHLTGMTSGAPPPFQPVNCTGDVANNPVIGAVSPGATQTYYIDGYFSSGTLAGVNSQVESATINSFTRNYYFDTSVASTPATEASSGGSSNTQSVTVVNTPFNNGLTSAFVIAPFYVGPCAVSGVPTIALTFTNVSAAGVTSPCSSSSTAAVLPSGTSPYPPDAGTANATRVLYQAGAAPVYYNVNTTAIFPTVSGNATQVCVARTGGLPDTFVKPERVLMWILQNAPGGTTYNSVPNITSIGSLAGDITGSVTSSGASYVKLPATITFPQVPQAQPSQVCGMVNGFVSGGAGATFAVLEPINFPPYVVAGATAISTAASKGSTSADSDVYLELSASQTHDYNDHDPCYISGTREACDDNPYLYAWVFGGGNTGGSSEITTPYRIYQQPSTTASAPYTILLSPETASSAGTNAYNLEKQLNLTAAAQLYVAVADQATGADTLNTGIAGSTNYTSNPFHNQGGFLTASYNATMGGLAPVCDPGSQSTGYSLSAAACAGAFAPSSTSERYVYGGSLDGPSATTTPLYTIGNVGAQLVLGTASAGSGLIPLPFPDGSTPPTSSAPVNPGSPGSGNALTGAAIENVTPGQTAGFIWNWLNGQTVSSTSYTLGCILVSSDTGATATTFPTGMSCSISNPDPNAASPNTFTSSTSADSPTIYVVTSGNQFAQVSAPVWRRVAGGVMLAMLLPIFFFRRRSDRGLGLFLLLMFCTASLLAGCGTSGSTISTTANVTPAGSYFFRVTATPVNGATTTTPEITSAVFEVVVQNPN